MKLRIVMSVAVCAAAFLSPVVAQAPAASVEQWDTHELAFSSTTKYKNPFVDVSLKVTFAHSGGVSITVDGFYDGEATWRARFMPLQLGPWSYRTTSNDSALNGRVGSINCIPTAKSYLHGPLLVDGFHFRLADGTRPFLISTRLSCQFDDPSSWSRLISVLKGDGINRVLFMMGGVRGTVAGLYGGDLWSYNVKKFQAIDAFIDALRRADILASPYFYYFDDGFQLDLTEAQDEAYVRYGMARFGAYANVMPVLANEVELKFTDRNDPTFDLRSFDWANRLGGLLRQLAVFGVPVSVHNPMETFQATNPGFFTLLKDWPFHWANFMLRQMQVGALGAAEALTDGVPEPLQPAWNPRAYARHNDLLINLRRFNVPVINEEPGYELRGKRSWNGMTRETVRAAFWSAAAAGAYAMWGSPATYDLRNPLRGIQQSKTGQDLRALGLIMNQLPFWQMVPRNDLVTPGFVVVGGDEYRTNFLAVSPASDYLIYSLQGGDIQVTVQPGIYEVGSIKLNSVDGDRFDAGPMGQVSAANGTVSLSLASGSDWGVVLRKPTGQSSPPPPSPSPSPPPSGPPVVPHLPPGRPGF